MARWIGQVSLNCFWALSITDISEGHDRELLVREITAIQELLDEQPDSKCKLDLSVYLSKLIPSM